MPEEIKVVLNSEEDLQFHYTSKINIENFREICHKQQITIDFQKFPALVKNLIDEA